MKDSDNKYTPINYDSWNFNGQGMNIVPFLNEKEKKLWNANLPFIDKRDDLGHIELVTYFTLNLLDMFPHAIREVCVPAAILHDNGWSQMTETELNLFYESKQDEKGIEIWRRYEPILRARHQELGADLAKKTLKQQNWPNKETYEICEIIFGHDTRKGFYSPEDGIVRSSDKLYRFTFPHLGQAMRNRKTWTLEKLDSLMGEWIDEPGYFWNDDNKIKEIARNEKQSTLNYAKADGAKEFQKWVQMQSR